MAVYSNYQTDPKLCGTASYTLNRSFKYLCGMYIKLCQASLVSMVVYLSLSLSIMIRVFVLACIVARFQAKIMKVNAFLCLKMAL